MTVRPEVPQEQGATSCSSETTTTTGLHSLPELAMPSGSMKAFIRLADEIVEGLQVFCAKVAGEKKLTPAETKISQT